MSFRFLAASARPSAGRSGDDFRFFNFGHIWISKKKSKTSFISDRHWGNRFLIQTIWKFRKNAIKHAPMCASKAEPWKIHISQPLVHAFSRVASEIEFRTTMMPNLDHMISKTGSKTLQKPVEMNSRPGIHCQKNVCSKSYYSRTLDQHFICPKSRRSPRKLRIIPVFAWTSSRFWIHATCDVFWLVCDSVTLECSLDTC